jgi:hypothetical protein
MSRHTEQCCIIRLCRVIAAQLPVGHAVLFLSNKLIYLVRNIGNIAKFSTVLC